MNVNFQTKGLYQTAEKCYMAYLNQTWDTDWINYQKNNCISTFSENIPDDLFDELENMMDDLDYLQRIDVMSNKLDDKRRSILKNIIKTFSVDDFDRAYCSDYDFGSHDKQQDMNLYIDFVQYQFYLLEEASENFVNKLINLISDIPYLSLMDKEHMTDFDSSGFILKKYDNGIVRIICFHER